EEPPQLLDACVAASTAAGVKLVPGCRVLDIETSAGTMSGIHHEQGVTKCGVLVNAAGGWSRSLPGAAWLPLAPLRHQLAITGPIAGVRPEEPIVRVIDDAVYVRPARGGLMVGGFERNPLPVDPALQGDGFEMDQLSLDGSVLRGL